MGEDGGGSCECQGTANKLIYTFEGVLRVSVTPCSEHSCNVAFRPRFEKKFHLESNHIF